MTGVTGDIFVNIGLVFIIAAIAAFVLRLFKQPQILAYVIVGVLITPVFKIVTNTNIIESMSTIGVAFLLFIVGLEMDLKKLKNVALVSTLGGAVQISILFLTGFLGALLFGFLNMEAMYIGLLITFSSTMVVMKLLSDKKELNTLHGRIAVGMLLLQDIVAIFALSIFVSINQFSISVFAIALLKFLAMFALAFISGKYIFPEVFRFSAKNQELLLITSLAVCFTFSLAFHYLGFSIAIGAFLAGLALGNLEYNFEIIGRVKSLRDFFALIFFVSLGMGLSLGVLKNQWPTLIFMLGMVLLIKPLYIMFICSVFKYTKKPAFLTSISLAQVGEFSLILAAQGLVLGHISQELFSLTVVVALITITATSYFIKYDHGLYRFMEKPLGIFDSFTTEGLEFLPSEIKPKILLCGQNRIGYSILKEFKKIKKKVLIIDYNPEMIDQLVKEGYHCIYGDVTDAEIIDKMSLESLTLLISTVPEAHDNFHLINKLRAVNKKAKIIVTASEIDQALKLYKHGADYVIMPHFLGGEHGANLINSYRKKKINLGKEKLNHMEHLKERKEQGHEHPKE